jgi:hypothetical protein
MVARGDADARKAALWSSLDALGRSRPHLLLEGESPETYVARWQGSPVPAHVLAGRLRRALPGSRVLAVRSFAARAAVSRAARQHVTIEFALDSGAVAD